MRPDQICIPYQQESGESRESELLARPDLSMVLDDIALDRQRGAAPRPGRSMAVNQSQDEKR